MNPVNQPQPGPAGVAAATPARLRLWLLFCAFWGCAGWILSAIHLLNPVGYALAVMAGAVLLVVYYKVAILRHVRPRLGNPIRRFRRLVPLTFLVLAALAFAGGVIHPPTNYDALAYRIPRVLHWLAAERWHWIHTEFHRLNTRGCGIEWLSAPMLALLRTDRLLFLINIISLCVFPFAARPIIMVALGLDAKGFDRFIAQRRETLPPFVARALRP